MLYCPHCNGSMEIDDAFDTEFYGTSYYNSVYGTCSKCGRQYKWVEKYQYVGYEDVEEITKEDE